MIYGLFMLACGCVAMFFVFNTGQLSSEKTKLVNTADAVAYSAGLLHARALNFDAYTNRALMANEVIVAQTVSLASWVKYAEGHVSSVPAMNCYYVVYAVPTWLGLAEYLPLCVALSWPPGAAAVRYAKKAAEPVSEVIIGLSELAKLNLQMAQTTMYATLLPVRQQLLREVADANYRNNGEVKVDLLPLTDNFTSFEGEPFIRSYSGNDRARFKDAEVTAAYKDSFVPNRSWSSSSPWPCILMPRGDAERSGATKLENYDDWKASDRASLHTESWHVKMFSMGCETDAEYGLGSGGQSAKDLGYKGVPEFHDLSKPALGKGDPRLRFSIRLTRETGQTMTSAGRSQVRPSGSMAIYKDKSAGGVLAAVASSEVYFERPKARDGGEQELPSLFNPYWQVHLVGNSASELSAAWLLQGVTR